MTITERICLVCGILPYLEPAVCSVCRDRIPYLLGTIHRRWQHYLTDAGEPTMLVASHAELVDELHPVLVDELDDAGRPTGGQIEVMRPTGRRLLTGRRLHTHTPLAGPVRSTVNGNRVSGSTNRPLPVDVDDVDLTSPANIGSVTVRHTTDRPEDQVGELPAGTLLAAWAHTFAVQRQLGEHLPAGNVPALVRWLAVPTRVQWACANYPTVGAYVEDLGTVSSRLWRLAGDRNPRPEVLPTPCPDCELQTLVRRPADDWIECGDDTCARIMSPQEYQRHARRLATIHRPFQAKP